MKKNKSKKNSPFFRVLVLVVLLCVAVFGAIIISDLAGKDNESEQKSDEPEFITVKISDDNIYLDGEQMTLDSLKEYLDGEYKKGELPVVSLINDTEKPSDFEVYNKVADLLGKYGINVERMLPSSLDEGSLLSTKDEV